MYNTTPTNWIYSPRTHIIESTWCLFDIIWAVDGSLGVQNVQIISHTHCIPYGLMFMRIKVECTVTENILTEGKYWRVCQTMCTIELRHDAIAIQVNQYRLWQFGSNEALECWNVRAVRMHMKWIFTLFELDLNHIDYSVSVHNFASQTQPSECSQMHWNDDFITHFIFGMCRRVK